ncbi:MAG TPA: GDP-mannose 4,6-dehydratase [Casimicrobiaceae bacterium]
MKRLLLTGGQGFVGSTFARMIARDADLAGWQLLETPPELDVRDAAALFAMVQAAPADAVVHLAAQSFVPESFRDPASTIEVNVLGTLHLLQALRGIGFRGRMLYVGTGDVYGRVPEDALPVAEMRLPAPRNPYAVSKLAAEALCQQWSMTESVDVVLARPFNHIGWGQSDRFVVSDFAKQVSAIRRGVREPVVAVGDIDVTRDFTDVEDVVRAYFSLLEAGVAGQVYNVCSGREQSIRGVLERLAELAGVEITVREDPARLRNAEQRRIRGDPSKIRRATGWAAVTPLDVSLQTMLEYWEHGDLR